MATSDFRSDTVTRPTPAMRRAMAEAEVGDDVFGDDPTVRRLEEAVAGLLGKEAGLFVPSGTMGNQVAAHVHAPPGSEVICEEACHMLNYEVGGLARLSSLQTRPLPSERGRLDPEAVRARIRKPTLHTPGTGVVLVENTHNFAGGAILPLATLRAISGACRDAGVPLHLDGARLWNAAVASGIPLDVWAAEVDSVSVCLSKGLGAPIGSVLAGETGFIEKARRVRKSFGGAMRQVGVIAAAGLVAVETGIERLAEDHALAGRLAAGLAARPGIDLDPATVETNIVIFRLTDVPPERYLAAMEERGVLGLAAGPDLVRLVTHRDVGEGDVERALAATAEVLGPDGTARA